ncbi:MAG: FliG C-terminal domain-containing protein, partial [bacterium]
GESLALSLVKGLSKTEIRKIRSTLQEMGPVSFIVKKRVMEEFYFGFLSEQVQDESKEEGPIQPFEFLTELQDEQLLALLNKEDPPVIAMVLAQLEPEKRMLILDRVDPTEKGQILIELGSLEDIPLEGIIEVAARLREKSTYLPRTTNFSRGGGKEIAQIIGEMDSAEEERYLQTLQNEDPDLYEDVKKYHLTFIDIIEQFPDSTLRDIMNTVDLSDVSMAMKGVDQEIVDRIIGNLPQKKQAMYEPEDGPRPKRDVDTARKKVVDVARQMEKDGQFNVADLLGGGEMVE